jgi:hypothetical protein
MVEVSSAGDDRTANNSDAVRHGYSRTPMTAIKDLGAELLELINGVAEENPNAGRARARAQTEEAVVGKGATG